MALLGKGLVVAAAAVILFPQPIQALRRRGKKAAPHVFIHHMVGLTRTYGAAEWERDMVEAKNAGIEAFALNMGYEGWETDRVRDAYRVASTFPTVRGFKLFLSLDMNHFSHHFTDEGRKAAVVSLVNEFVGHPANFEYQGKGFLSTFSGGDETFGEATPDAGWQWIKDHSGPPIYFVPGFFVPPSNFSAWSSVDGMFKWHAWQYHAYGDRHTPGYTDADWQNSLGSKSFMAAVSPCFYTHYGPSSWNKNWYFGGEDHLLLTRWEELIGTDVEPEFVEILTYNDFGESHYMTSPHGLMHEAPADTTWIEGFDHTPWLRLSALYSHAYRHRGVFAPIEYDQLYIYYRPHPKNAVAPADSQGPPLHYEDAVDNIYAVAALKEAGEVVITNAGRSMRTIVGAGITKLEFPSFAPGGVSIELRRAERQVLHGTGMDIVQSPQLYNFNFYVADFVEERDLNRTGGTAPCYTLWNDPSRCCSSRDSRQDYHMQDCVYVGGGCQPSGFLSPADWARVPQTCRAAVHPAGYGCASVQSEAECCRSKDHELNDCVWGDVVFSSGARCESTAFVAAQGEHGNARASCGGEAGAFSG